MAPSLLDRLGSAPGSRLLVLNCSELGFCHAANLGVLDALRSGLATSASLIVPAPWARDAAHRYRGEDVGVRLTLNAEHDRYRWGPITQAPSLLDGDGGFPRSVVDLWDHADLDEVRRECRAQVERAVLWGLDVTHLDAHLDALVLRPEFFDIYLDLAVEYALPLRLAGTEQEVQAGFPFRALAAEAGVLFPDRVVDWPGDADAGAMVELLCEVEPGVTEVTFRPAVDTPELRAVTEDWQARTADHRLLTSVAPVTDALRKAGASLIGYRPLRALMRP
ncbi:MAG: ChbG/HpnK family deacetylase [Actinomycetota bacterium]|jgi:hypothetical protein|nr:ChbG/HpnK family deacetylase [Actinomycetota bacterium]